MADQLAFVYADFTAYVDAIEAMDQEATTNARLFVNTELQGEWETVAVPNETVPGDLLSLVEVVAASFGWKRSLDASGRVSAKRQSKPQPAVGWPSSPAQQPAWTWGS
jgi:hypothetical protein